MHRVQLGPPSTHVPGRRGESRDTPASPAGTCPQTGPSAWRACLSAPSCTHLLSTHTGTHITSALVTGAHPCLPHVLTHTSPHWCQLPRWGKPDWGGDRKQNFGLPRLILKCLVDIQTEMTSRCGLVAQWRGRIRRCRCRRHQQMDGFKALRRSSREYLEERRKSRTNPDTRQHVEVD